MVDFGAKTITAKHYDNKPYEHGLLCKRASDMNNCK